MSAYWKGVLTGVTPTLVLAVISFLFFDVFVDRAVVPEVISQLKDKNYVSDDLKKGEYVATNKQSFNKNHVIDYSILLSLKDGKFALNNELEKVEKGNNDQIQKIVNNYKRALFEQSEQMALTRSDIEKLKNMVSVLDAKLNKSFEIEVYYNNDSEYKGKIQLNTNNILVKNLLTNGVKYHLVHGENEATFSAVLRPLKVGGEVSYSPVASLYIGDHMKLFSNSTSSGIGEAELQW